MKQLLLALAFFPLQLCAQKADVRLQQPGTLARQLAGRTDIVELIVRGRLDDADQRTLRAMTRLEVLDLHRTTNRTLADSAFAGMTRLRSCRLPRRLQSTGACTFLGCTSLQQVDVPATLEVLAPEMFRGCTRLERLTLHQCRDLYTLGRAALMGSGVRVISVPQMLRSVEMLCFADCPQLERFVLPQYVERVGSLAFARCPRLRDVFVAAPTPPDTAEDAFLGTDGCHLHARYPQFYRDRQPWSRLVLDYWQYNGAELQTTRQERYIEFRNR